MILRGLGSRLAYSTHSASSKLFADAAKEEAQPARQKSAYLQALEQKHENWTGEENVQDAVLRMLVDKYKPLRTGTVSTADKKLKQSPPKLLTPASGSWATESLLPSSDSHKPWHTEFRVPPHVVSIKSANIPPPPRRILNSPKDEQGKKKEREFIKRTEQAGRLGRARETTLDYRLGLKSKGDRPPQPNPVSMKGWTSLVEDKIENARSAGVFNNIKGRGQPITQAIEERNPFIRREEFLMNRILQRNEAAPPWVELQSELDTAITTFRELLHQSYTRRVVRNLTAIHPPAFLATRISLQYIKAHRDPEWEEQERKYHDLAIEEINALVRKYNGVAPYTVRRAYHVRRVEFSKLYEECAEDILNAVRERVEGASPVSIGSLRKVSRVEGHKSDDGSVGFRDFLFGWADRLLARWRGKS